MKIEIDEDQVLAEIAKQDVLYQLEYGVEPALIEAYLMVLKHCTVHSEYTSWIKKHNILEQLMEMKHA